MRSSKDVIKFVSRLLSLIFPGTDHRPAAPTADTNTEDMLRSHAKLARKAAAEGMVLLQNKGKALPVKKGDRVALFGNGQINYQLYGGGSGSVPNATRKVSLLEGMQNKLSEGRMILYQPLINDYLDFFENGGKGEMPLTSDQIKGAANQSDTAVITISRNSSEGSDRKAIKGDYYLTDQELSMIAWVSDAGFKNVVVVLNIPGIIDTSWIRQFPDISVLISWLPGMEGGNATADVLCGNVNPSGKLTDTFAGTYAMYPSANNFGRSNYFVNYEEDIYIGYRYFETFDPGHDQINYCFGCGLSYTSFRLSHILVKQAGEEIHIKVTVKNTGDMAGREVVQVYFSAPQGRLGKPARQLAGFQKTSVLNPGEDRKIQIQFPISDMASYDDNGKLRRSAYLLEAGHYTFYVGQSLLDADRRGIQGTFYLKKTLVTQQLTRQAGPAGLRKRLLADGSCELLEDSGAHRSRVAEKTVAGSPPPVSSSKIMLQDAAGTPSLMDPFLNQLSNDQLAALASGAEATVAGGTGGIGNLESFGIPNAQTADGPAGLRLSQPATAWPVETLLAATWDPQLLEAVGRAIGSEAMNHAIDIWLGPGMNIHRDPLNGRNFEYWSEDPLISGKMGAAIIRGVQSKGILAEIKHFAANNRETHRKESDSRLSERALREIYLRGFQIAIKEAHPMLLMSAYNRINGIRTSENRDLLTHILRKEWHFNGAVTTDWNNTAAICKEILAGNNVRMPANVKNTEHLMLALRHGRITRQDLVDNAKPILSMIIHTRAFRKSIKE